MQRSNRTVVLLFLVLMAATGCRQSSENKALAGIRELPRFTLLALDSPHLLTSAEIPTGRPLVFFYFDPECSHCQKETEGIISRQAQFRNVRFYFLSNARTREIDSFSRYFHLDSLPNVFVGTDYQYTFFNAFLPSSIPYMAVYNNRKILTKIYNGEADMKSLISFTRK